MAFPRSIRAFRCLLALTILAGCSLPTGIARAGEPAPASGLTPQQKLASIHVPDGFVVERVAYTPLVDRPIMAGFDDRGRLYVSDSAGVNLPAAELLKNPPHRIVRLEDTDGDGIFDRSTVFADRMVFPQGACWLDGSLYVMSPPYLWKLTDTDGDGVADRREALVGEFGFTGNAADVHGPFAGPDGRLYWCDGRHGHHIVRPDGTTLEGKAARIFRCRPDGSDVEVVCGGGMDNPVEIAFTPEGEPLVTCNLFESQPKRVDAIFYAIDGGVFPWNDVLSEFKRTGDLLPPAGDLGWVAAAGFMRYRGAPFGPGFRDSYFSAQFNPHRVQHHVIERDGAGFKVKSEDFLTSSDPDFHPTDVLEDADGSLLVVDTGGWFRIGCPVSKIAKPQIYGAIYRVRKKDAPRVEDPWGVKLAWDKVGARELIARLSDPRHVVEDRAIDVLVKAGKESVSALEELATNGKGRPAVDAVWALGRIDTPEARETVRRAMVASAEPGVSQAAARTAGLSRDGPAVHQLLDVLARGTPAAVREAATALGRIGDPGAVAPLLSALPDHQQDRFAEHAILYALIQIHDAKGTRDGLAAPEPNIQRGALIALDQMDAGGLTSQDVLPLMDPAQPELRKAATWVISHHPEWGQAMLGFFRGELAKVTEGEKQRESLRDQLAAFSKGEPVRRFIAETLHDDATPAASRLLLLEAIAAAPLDRMPAEWAPELARGLSSGDERIVRQSLIAIRAFPADKKLALDAPLMAVASDAKRSAEVRVLAASVAAPRAERLDPAVFAFVLTCLAKDQPSLLRATAADALGRAKLDDAQRDALVQSLPTAGPLELPRLLAAFDHPGNSESGTHLVAALDKSPGLKSLRSDDLNRVLENYPPAVRDAAKPLLQRLAADSEKQKAHLAELEPLLATGDPSRGRELFFGNKAACSTCHTVQGRGGRVGPDLSKIASIRAPRDLLESVVYPSASFARGFEPVIVKTRDGDVQSGIIARETADAVYLYNAQRVETRIGRADIADLRPSPVSIMPEGLDAQLSRENLADLLAFLQSLK